jgi:hypothetical protein
MGSVSAVDATVRTTQGMTAAAELSWQVPQSPCGPLPPSAAGADSSDPAAESAAGA